MKLQSSRNSWRVEHNKLMTKLMGLRAQTYALSMSSFVLTVFIIVDRVLGTPMNHHAHLVQLLTLVLLTFMLAALVIISLPALLRLQNVLPLGPGLVITLASLTEMALLPGVIEQLTVSGKPTLWLNLVQDPMGVAQISAVAGAGVVGLWLLLSSFTRTIEAPAKVERVKARPSRPPEQSQSSAQSDEGAAEPTAAQKYPARHSKLTFANMRGMVDFKVELKASLASWRAKQGNGILLFGPPGTGKTFAADVIAGELKLPILKVGYGELASQWVGESTKNLREVFEAARAQGPLVLFFDEVDSLLSERGSRQTEEYNRLVTSFLTCLSDLRRDHPETLVIAATNHRKSLDQAAVRIGRFDYPIMVPLPDHGARKHLIESTIKPLGVTLKEGTFERTARRFGGYNVTTIVKIMKVAAEHAQKHGRSEIEFDDLLAGQRAASGEKPDPLENAKFITELFYAPSVKAALEREARNLRNLGAFEASGGEMTKGIMLAGPPGTGKTAAVQAFAKETGWPLLSYSGKDLMALDAIEKLKERAGLCRPAIVFIDEADDILGDRTYSSHKEATNALLQAIDGAGGNLHDILWMIATNNPNAMDSAAVRGGRFGKRIDLDIPDLNVMRDLVSWWAVKNIAHVPADDAGWVGKVSEVLEGLSQASALTALKDAKNIAASEAFESGGIARINMSHVLRARSEMAG